MCNGSVADRWAGTARILFPLLGLGFAVAGADKLLGQSGYRRMFREWGWGEGAQRSVGAAELTGGALIACPLTRQLGGAVLTATSAAMLAAELHRGRGELALPRLALLIAAAGALCPGASRRSGRA
ncbi:MAG TPA: DoxX family protein [Acetobacteraceae bacterium]|nr:DoxX family protein [Acetobacteraceae bacterium]